MATHIKVILLLVLLLWRSSESSTRKDFCKMSSRWAHCSQSV